MNFDDFVRDLVESGDYWLFSVAPGLEWLYVLAQVGREFFPGCEENNKDFGFVVSREEEERNPVYWARRSKLPVEVVVVRFGIGLAELKQAQIIERRPFPAEPIPPTVNYYGTA